MYIIAHSHIIYQVQNTCQTISLSVILAACFFVRIQFVRFAFRFKLSLKFVALTPLLPITLFCNEQEVNVMKSLEGRFRAGKA